MKPLDLILLAVIVCAVLLALRYLYKHRGNSCNHCSGNCASCPSAQPKSPDKPKKQKKKRP